MAGRTRTSPGRARAAKVLPVNPFIALGSTVRPRVEERLGVVFAAELERARQVGPGVAVMVEALRDLSLRGGKRTRAVLAVAGYRLAVPGAGRPVRAAGGAEGALGSPRGNAAGARAAEPSPALEAGVALELLQTYLLVHDDWMDGDRVRRGGPAVHAALAQALGSRARGDASGVLAGDFASALALRVLAAAPVVAERLGPALACFAEMQLDAIAGQQLDLLAESDPELVYRLKTGSYSVRGPLRLGALLGGGRPRLLTTLDAFALPLGVAFQLRDDLLGAFGDPAETGKPFGTDLRQGKRTLLVHLALKRARGRDHRVLNAALGARRATPAALAAATRVLETSGARALVEQRISALVAEAAAAIAGAPLRAEGAALLEGALRALTARSA